MEVEKIYQKLLKLYGPQGWWPIYIPTNCHGLTYGIPYENMEQFRLPFRDPYFEIAIGAILTQNVAWKNVAQAIVGLYEAKALTPKRLIKLKIERLKDLLRPTRYYAQKAKSIRLFSQWLVNEYDASLLKLRKVNKTSPSVPLLILPRRIRLGRKGEEDSLDKIRSQLLERWGIGNETADSIMLYALNLPIFVVDIYTKRLCAKFGIVFKKYDEYRQFFESQICLNQSLVNLPKSVLYQEYHALIVASGQDDHRKL